ISRIGTLNAEQLTFASEVLPQTPDLLIKAAREPYGARALVIALLVDRHDDAYVYQVDHIAQLGDPLVNTRYRALLGLVEKLPLAYHLPLLDLSLPALLELSLDERTAFVEVLEAIQASKRNGKPFDIALHSVVTARLSQRYQESSRKRVHPSTLRQHAHELLQALAILGNRDRTKAIMSYGKGCEVAGLRPRGLKEVSSEKLLATFTTCLTALQDAPLPWKERLARACAHVVLHDEVVTISEIELLRAICETFEVPAPVFQPPDKPENSAKDAPT
ncbi:MAG: hypothetical protein KDD60_07840, partial [Bdellovibrionales bacterium]|nr:hypothetical protein [Bdellovibrionales bacterium]